MPLIAKIVIEADEVDNRGSFSLPINSDPWYVELINQLTLSSAGIDRREGRQPDDRHDNGLQLPRGLLQLVPHPPRHPHHHRAHSLPLSADHHRLVPGLVLQVSEGS